MKESTNEPTFEESLQELEETVQRLEEDSLGLQDALACYEQGVKHLRRCYRSLEQAEQRIEMLTGLDAEGSAVTQPFHDDENAPRSQRRSHPDEAGQSSLPF